MKQNHFVKSPAGTALESMLAALLSIACLITISATAHAQDTAPIRVAIVGLVHGHVKGFLSTLPKAANAKLVAIVEPDVTLTKQYQEKYHLESTPTYTDLEAMLNKEKLDAVLIYTTIKDHRRVVEAAARHHVSSMMEKPLAISLDDALAIRKTAQDNHVHVLVNYDTNYYTNNTEAIRLAHDGKLGTIRKVFYYAGHEGPKEIGVGPEWLPWLTDPALNGAGALYDFGCYGADLSTVLMQGKAPISVTAVAQTDKPDIYTKVDDDATIILKYDGVQTVLMPSWNWSFSRKDLEIYGNAGEVATIDTQKIQTRYKGEKAPTESTAPALPTDRDNSLDYLAAVLHGSINDQGLYGSLDTNVTVVQIMDAARESVRTGKTVMLKPLP
jgi:glucose-fructose oxidoreductase